MTNPRRHVRSTTYNPFGVEAEGEGRRTGESAQCRRPLRIFGISLRGALIVTAGRHSQLLCLLSWRGCADSKGEERSRRRIGAPAGGRIV